MIAVGDKEQVGEVELEVYRVGGYTQLTIRAEFNINNKHIERYRSHVPEYMWNSPEGRRDIAYRMGKDALVQAYKIDS